MRTFSLCVLGGRGMWHTSSHSRLPLEPTPSDWTSVLLFYCCVTNDHTLNGFKQHPLLAHSSVVQNALWDFLLRVSYSQNPGVGFEAYLGGSRAEFIFRIFPAFGINQFPCVCKTEMPVSLWAISQGWGRWGVLSASRGHSQSLVCVPSILSNGTWQQWYVMSNLSSLTSPTNQRKLLF